jgi:hypothetical protein
MPKTRFDDPYTCIQCGKEVTGNDDDDGDTRWINVEKPGYNYPGYPGDPVCVGCYLVGPTVDRKDEV